MRLVNTNNQGIVDVPEHLALELLQPGIWKEPAPEKKTRTRATKTATED